MISPWCEALCIVINFLVLWFICLSSFLIHLKNGTKYPTRGTTQLFIPLMRFLLQRLALRSFLIRLRYSFLSFLFDGVRLQYSQVIGIFFFCKSTDASLIRKFYYFCCFSFPTFHYEQGTFLMPNSISTSWLKILICILVSSSFSFLVNVLSCLILSCDFVNL